MINFPIFNPARSATENNRTKKNTSVKASKESAEIAAQKPVTTMERRREPTQRRQSTPKKASASRKAQHIDIEV